MQSVKYKFGRGILSNRMHRSGHLDSTSLSENAALSDGRPTKSVSIENISNHVNRREIVDLFAALIGEVRGFQDIEDSPDARLQINFADSDAALKALCMNGYTVAGVPLKVSLLTTATFNGANKLMADDRRNLYVLGLPFALTKHEFAAIFAQYGTVSHCVILATVDNSSRRRGFVVMSSHAEAKQAMAALTRTQIKGHTIDVSWAVVQRSQGFLDGGDRAVLLEPRSQLCSPDTKYDRHKTTSSRSSSSSLDSQEGDPVSLTIVPLPTKALLVSNLPTLLFSQAQDFHPLFIPFGHIERLEIVQVLPLGTISVLVQYTSASVAQEAKECLSGQIYGTHRIDAHFVMSSAPDILHSRLLTSTTVHNKLPPYLSLNGASDHARSLLNESSARSEDVSIYNSHLNHPTGSSTNSNGGPPRSRLLAVHSKQSSLPAISPPLGGYSNSNNFIPDFVTSEWAFDQGLEYLADGPRQFSSIISRPFSTVCSSFAV